MYAIEDFRADFYASVGEGVREMIEDNDIDRWINRGQARLGIYLPSEATITWSASDLSIPLPADFHHNEEIVTASGVCIPAGRVWGKAYSFAAAATSAGTAKLRYWAKYPKITNRTDSLLPETGDDGCVAYALYCFYKFLASSRSDFRTYATLTGQNGVTAGDLDAISERYFADFQDARDALKDEHFEPTTFYEG